MNQLFSTRVQRQILSASFLLCIVSGAVIDSSLGDDDRHAEDRERLSVSLENLQQELESLNSSLRAEMGNEQSFHDCTVFAKAVEWMLRHDEFPKKDYADQASAVLQMGMKRCQQFRSGTTEWPGKNGVVILGYRSSIDDSIQPYAVTLPEEFDAEADLSWPLHVKLHGRYNDMNEVNFISRHGRRKRLPDQNWIQLDVYGRGNNAYRWAGETDVFEAIEDVASRYRIDRNRITLHGFSMGGAGAWHLGLHHPAVWSSVGPAAGFVDFYEYQKQTAMRPEWQHATLGVYDAIDYALNAANVPVCTYGGENDSQLVASTSVTEKAKSLNVDVKLLIGPGMGHKFHPDSYSEFMDFHKHQSKRGRLKGLQRKQIRFTTRTLKYNRCDWIAIDGVEKGYAPATVEASLADDGMVHIATSNVSHLAVDSEVGNRYRIDGVSISRRETETETAASAVCCFQKTSSGWKSVSTAPDSRFAETPELHKRHDLQGPIDDAFMSAFVCVTGSGKPESVSHHSWVSWTLQRFEAEFDKWLRGRIHVVSDLEVTDELLATRNLILFGDPASNSIIERILPQLPLEWSSGVLTVDGRQFDMSTHGLSLIYPNPLNPRKYVVINSGHTFHEDDFRNSNSWLFPRLGDIAIQKFERRDDGGFDEVTEWAENFNNRWMLDD